jgi:hypothetical protein
MCIVNFITLFPIEQGVNISASGGSDAQGYLTFTNMVTNPSSTIESMNNDTETGFDQWDVTQGFMGSNSIKQSSTSGFTSQATLIYTNLKSMVIELFGINSPVFIVLGILFSMAIGYFTYMVIKFIRTGL